VWALFVGVWWACVGACVRTVRAACSAAAAAARHQAPATPRMARAQPRTRFRGRHELPAPHLMLHPKRVPAAALNLTRACVIAGDACEGHAVGAGCVRTTLAHHELASHLLASHSCIGHTYTHVSHTHHTHITHISHTYHTLHTSHTYHTHDTHTHTHHTHHTHWHELQLARVLVVHVRAPLGARHDHGRAQAQRAVHGV
jgi:hypothetical protein